MHKWPPTLPCRGSQFSYRLQILWNWVHMVMCLASWYDSIPFYFCTFNISALMLTYYYARNRCDTPMRAVQAHVIARTLNARFSLSLYCLWHLYSVTSRRWTNDHGSSGPRSRLDKRSSRPPQNMSQSFYLSKASLVLHPSSFSLLIYCITGVGPHKVAMPTTQLSSCVFLTKYLAL